ncbi:hypothetical protein [Archangium sp.]|uniref:hypothetical protein n=1 Tax=Archangium sp. TaxID=1872627 RepID=UPI002D4318BA|nr:hypothetical protein [Archangium sp.]HYO53516.1 hypothetical protein [Archangium sp.]
MPEETPNTRKRKGGAKQCKSVPAEAKPQTKKQKNAPKDDHVAWDGPTSNHKTNKDGYGCIWRHHIEDNGWDTHPCNHQLNGFYASADTQGDRYALYSRDFLSTARNLRYVEADDSMTEQARARVKNAGARVIAQGVRKSEGFDIDKYVNLAKTAFYWLQREDGWKINVCPQPEPRNRLKQNQPNFYPRQSKTKGGHGAWYPYEHNYHHLIPIGAVEEFVVGKTGAETVRSEQVIKIVLMSRWNIHNRLNMMLLPQQEIVAEVVGLPAHCPWGIPSHVEYQNSLESKLKDIRAKILEAIVDGNEHPDLQEVQIDFDNISKTLFEKVKNMKAGLKLGKVEWP